MRKLSVVLASLLVSSLGTAFAQDESTVTVGLNETPTTNYYAGGSLGLNVSDDTTGVFTGHFGIKNLLSQNLDTRFDLSALFTGGISLGAFAIYNFDVSADAPISAYVGAGPKLRLSDPVLFGLGLRAGGDYALTEAVNGFAELRLDPLFGSSNVTEFGVAAGVKYNF